jgi:sucrose phosphorylase
LNATYFSALSDPKDEKLGQARFQCSQAVALAMKGIPAIYFHSLCGSSNNREGVKETGQNRTINRKKWEIEELESVLKEDGSPAEVFEWYTRALRRRSACPAFHPDGAQKILDFGSKIFAFERQSVDTSLTVVCLFNFLPSETKIEQAEVIESYFPKGFARDLLSGGDLQWSKTGLTLRPYQALWLCSL